MHLKKIRLKNNIDTFKESEKPKESVKKRKKSTNS